MRLVLAASKFAGIAVRPLGSGAPEKARRWPLAMVVAVSDFGCWGSLRQRTLRLRLTHLEMNPCHSERADDVDADEIAVLRALGVGSGLGVHGGPAHQLMVTESTRQPWLAPLLSLAIRQRRIMPGAV